MCKTEEAIGRKLLELQSQRWAAETNSTRIPNINSAANKRVELKQIQKSEQEWENARRFVLFG